MNKEHRQQQFNTPTSNVIFPFCCENILLKTSKKEITTIRQLNKTFKFVSERQENESIAYCIFSHFHDLFIICICRKWHSQYLPTFIFCSLLKSMNCFDLSIVIVRCKAEPTKYIYNFRVEWMMKKKVHNKYMSKNWIKWIKIKKEIFRFYLKKC